MWKGIDALLTFSVLNCICSINGGLTDRNPKKSQQYLAQNTVLVTILQNCNLGLKNIAIHDMSNDSSTFNVISSLRPSFTRLLAISSRIRAEPTYYHTEFQGIVIARRLPRNETLVSEWWNHYLKIINIEWKLSRNCSIFVIPKPNAGCSFSKLSFLQFKRLYIFNVFFICILYGQPVIYSYDSYGDNRSSLWKKVTSNTDFNNQWTVYRRGFETDNICEGLLLNNEFLRRNVHVTVGIEDRAIQTSRPLDMNELYKERDDKTTTRLIKQEIINGIKALLGLRVNYYLANNTNELFNQTNKQTSVDVCLILIVEETMRPWEPSLPVYYDEYTIISHNQGYMEPIEKISHFYGRWTLISLCIISTLIFIVIWLEKRRTSLAFFDILRLLINGSILVPIDTLPLRIFFTMIFLYFLVLQATFSGHLAKFLTQPQLRKNIDSIEDLKNPRIKTIYNHGYIFEESGNEDLLNKSTNAYTMRNCLQLMKRNRDSVCVGTKSYILRFLESRNKKNQYYMSKNKFLAAPIVLPIRDRFPANEQMRWAVLYLTDVRISHCVLILEQKRLMSSLSRRKAIEKIDFRPIKLSDLKFAFIILGVGIMVACICFSFELLIRLKMKKNCRRKKVVR